MGANIDKITLNENDLKVILDALKFHEEGAERQANNENDTKKKKVWENAAKEASDAGHKMHELLEMISQDGDILSESIIGEIRCCSVLMDSGK